MTCNLVHNILEIYSILAQPWFATIKMDTANNTEISLNFSVWKFYGKAQFPQSFARIAQNFMETVPFHKTSIPRN